MLTTISSLSPLRAFAAETTLQTLIRTRDIQTDLPLRQETVWPMFQIPEWLVGVLLWGSVVVGVATIAIAMRDSLPGIDRSRRLASEADAPGGQSALDAMSVTQTEADELAARGLYAEAIHVLLLRALAEVRDRLQTRFADSLTSREILRRAPLEGAAKQGFAYLVGVVELVRFGNAEAGREHYVACREQFETIRRSLSLRAAG